MRIDTEVLSAEEMNKLFPDLRIVLDDKDGRAHFEKKERPVPPGMKRLPDGKLIPWTPIEQLLTKW